MDESKPKKAWWRPQIWWPAVLIWVIALEQLSFGPMVYGYRRGWVGSPAMRAYVTYVAWVEVPEPIGRATGLWAYTRWWDDLGRRHAGLPPAPPHARE